jgi:hypothetical protein
VWDGAVPIGQGKQLRSQFGGSTLVSLLASWVDVDVKATRQDIAERLGTGLSVADAMSLHAVLQTLAAPAAIEPAQSGLSASKPAASVGIHKSGLAQAEGALGAATPLQAACDQVHAALAANLTSMPLATGDAASDASFAAYHQRYLDLQRHMAARIEGLREQVRQTLTMASPRLAQLAALDAVLEQTLGAREQKLLASVPVLLEQRFVQLCQCEAAPDDAANPSDASAIGTAHFLRDMRAVLMAELDLRMQAVRGLVDAYNSEIKLSR